MNFVSKRIQEINEYKSGEQVDFIVKLNTNENPYPPTSKINEVLNNIDIDCLKLYPNKKHTDLINSISKKYGIENDSIYVGNGSDEILAQIFMAFFDGKEETIAYPDITYSFYPVYSDFLNVNSEVIELNDNFEIDLKDYENLNAKGFIFTNPNAPTGIALDKKVLEDFIKNHPKQLVIVDEAYIDFCDESVVELTKKYDNLLVVHTFSKGYSLAGIRCGYAIGNSKLVVGLNKVKDCLNSYPLDTITQKIAQTAVEDVEYYKNINSKIRKTREVYTEKLSKIGFKVLKSSSNFIFVEHNVEKAEDIYQQLKDRKILVRYFNLPKIDNHLRITIGTDKEMEILYTNLLEILNVK